MLDRVLSARSGKTFLAEQLQFLRDHTAVIKQVTQGGFDSGLGCATTPP